MPKHLMFNGDIAIYENTEHYEGVLTFNGEYIAYVSREYGTVVWTPYDSVLLQLLELKEAGEESLAQALDSCMHHMCNSAAKSTSAFGRMIDEGAQKHAAPAS